MQGKWSGRCSNCGAWNSFIEENTGGSSEKKSLGRALKTSTLTQIGAESRDRLKSGMAEIDQVLGGGIVAGSLMLLAGEPGVGKSTLLLQLANAIAANHPTLYISGEESLQQLKLRADRLKVKANHLTFATATNSDDIAATVAEGKFQLIIVDSIQTVATNQLTSAAGTASQITASAQLLLNAAKKTHCAVLLVGHVTKEGNIAGPKILEHLVDVVLYLEGERTSSFKLLRGVKNRFGATDEIGIFAMEAAGMMPVANPSAAFLSERTGGDGSTALATMEGSRAILVEVQALVSPSPYGYPKRTVSGFDLNRLNLLVAVLGRRARLNLSAQDVYVNLVGGLKVAEPAADLAVALAIASAARTKPIINKTVVFGEVGLSGEVRSVNLVEKRVAEAKKLGFTRAIGPPGKTGGNFIQSVRTLAQAIETALG